MNNTKIPRPFFAGEEKRPGTIRPCISRKVGMCLLYIVLKPYVNWTILLRFYVILCMREQIVPGHFSSPAKKVWEQGYIVTL